MKLSILTPTVPERAEKLAILTEKLAKQIGDLPVEHLVFSDNRRRSIGQKRQALLSAALGEYVAFVDDDDDVSDDYVGSILAATKTQPDCITFEQIAIYNGQSSRVIFGRGNIDEPFNPGGDTLRGPVARLRLASDTRG
jgi:glycosyltransferase involved in cell wall biosynthesis